jgi:hypothetical protein
MRRPVCSASTLVTTEGAGNAQTDNAVMAMLDRVAARPIPWQIQLQIGRGAGATA